MFDPNNRPRRHPHARTITWVSFQVLDRMLSKTAYFEISEHLAERGNHIDFFGIRSDNAIEADDTHIRLILIPLRCFPILTHMFYVTFLALVLPFYVAVRRPSFILTEPKFGSPIVGVVLRFFPRQLRPKAIMDIRSTPVEIHSLRASLGALAFDASIVLAKKTFDGFTIVTQSMKKEISERFRIKPEAIKVWNNGVNLELFRPEAFNRNVMRKKLGLTGKFIVFYHGSFSAHRGIIEAIESISILREEYPDLILFLLGGGPARFLIEELVQKRQLQNRVIVHTPVEYVDVPKFIAMCDLGIVPLPDILDWRYQCPLKLIEYLSMGKPVVVTDIPANREVTRESEFTIYVPSANPEEFARAIKYACNNIAKLEKSGVAGRQVIEDRYDWRKIAHEFENYLNEFSHDH